MKKMVSTWCGWMETLQKCAVKAIKFSIALYLKRCPRRTATEAFTSGSTQMLLACERTQRRPLYSSGKDPHDPVSQHKLTPDELGLLNLWELSVPFNPKLTLPSLLNFNDITTACFFWTSPTLDWRLPFKIYFNNTTILPSRTWGIVSCMAPFPIRLAQIIYEKCLIFKYLWPVTPTLKVLHSEESPRCHGESCTCKKMACKEKHAWRNCCSKIVHSREM